MTPRVRMASAEKADAAMTADREEIKYLLPPTHARKLIKLTDAELPQHRFRGAGANRLPGAHHHVTTIYFDTVERHIYRDCITGAANLTLRAKEYYDLHPDLVELATDASQLVKYTPVLWVETKARVGSRTRKNRLRLPKQEVPAFFAEGVITEAMVTIQQQQYGDQARAMLEEVRQMCSRFGTPLQADCLVNYRRRAWQDDEGLLRVTLDSNLVFFAPPEGLWARSTALVHGTLGASVGRQPNFVLELKTRGSLPGWLSDFLADLPASGSTDDAPRFSKFIAASEAVHG
jgi:SPX domain protein involved in polyphosphate accumulation